MLETQLSSRLVAQMKATMNGAVVFKHADRSTIGIPDISCTWQRRVLWIEVKYLRPKDLPYGTARLRPADFLLGKEISVQTEHMRKLSKQSKAVYIIYTNTDVICADPQYIWEAAMHGDVVPINRYTWSVEGATSGDPLFVFPRVDKQVLELINYFFENYGDK